MKSRFSHLFAKTLRRYIMDFESTGYKCTDLRHYESSSQYYARLDHANGAIITIYASDRDRPNFTIYRNNKLLQVYNIPDPKQ